MIVKVQKIEVSNTHRICLLSLFCFNWIYLSDV